MLRIFERSNLSCLNLKGLVIGWPRFLHALSGGFYNGYGYEIQQ